MASSVNMNETIDISENDVVQPTHDEDIPSSEQTPTTIGSGTETGSCKRKRPGKVPLKETWEHFERYEDPQTKKWRARCLHRKIVTYAIGNGTSTHGTTNLNKHIFDGGCIALKNKNAYEVLASYDNKMKRKKISQEVFREKMGMAIIKHNYPFSSVEHEGIKDVFSYLNPDVKGYTRNTAKADIINIYEREKERIKKLLSNAPGRICLTSDVWSSITSDGYLSLTAHFVDEKWFFVDGSRHIEHSDNHRCFGVGF